MDDLVRIPRVYFPGFCSASEGMHRNSQICFYFSWLTKSNRKRLTLEQKFRILLWLRARNLLHSFLWHEFRIKESSGGLLHYVRHRLAIFICRLITSDNCFYSLEWAVANVWWWRWWNHNERWMERRYPTLCFDEYEWSWLGMYLRCVRDWHRSWTHGNPGFIKLALVREARVISVHPHTSLMAWMDRIIKLLNKFLKNAVEQLHEQVHFYHVMPANIVPLSPWISSILFF